MKLFGTSGIRGFVECSVKIHDDEIHDNELIMSRTFCTKATLAFLKVLSGAPFNEKNNYNKKNIKKENIKSRKIAVGIDLRESSKTIKNHIFCTLIHEGYDPIDCGVIPTPALCYYTKQNNLLGAIMVTGSHISEDMNGLKFYNSQEEISKDDEKLIENEYDKMSDNAVEGVYKNIYKHKYVNTTHKIVNEHEKAKNTYINLLKKYITNASSFKRLKIILDAEWSCQNEIFTDILNELNVKLVLLHSSDTFKAIDTEITSFSDNILRKSIIENDANCAISFDGDGDRPIIIDENAEVFSGDLIGSIMADILNVNPLVVPISASSIVETLGKKVYRTKVGSPYVISKMKEIHSDFGFESNGGCIYGDVMHTRDSGITIVSILNKIANEKIRLSELKRRYAELFQYKTKFDFPSKKNNNLLEKIEKHYQINGRFKEDKTDGLKIYLDATTWLLFRPSSNAPEFRIFIESDNKEKLNVLVSKTNEIIEQMVSDMLKTD